MAAFGFLVAAYNYKGSWLNVNGVIVRPRLYPQCILGEYRILYDAIHFLIGFQSLRPIIVIDIISCIGDAKKPRLLIIKRSGSEHH